MQDVFSMIARLRRPPLLIKAAQIGAQSYRRKSLARILRLPFRPKGTEILFRLLEMEQDINALRPLGDGTYSALRHVEVLSAILAENHRQTAARLLETAPH